MKYYKNKMSRLAKSHISLLVVAVALTAVVSFGANALAVAFTQPTGAPASFNAPAPLDTSSFANSKAGALLLNTDNHPTGLVVQQSAGIGAMQVGEPIANSLTVDNAAHNMKICLNGTAAANCISTLTAGAAGSQGQIQYNNGGAFAGAPVYTGADPNGQLEIGAPNGVGSNNGTPYIDFHGGGPSFGGSSASSDYDMRIENDWNGWLGIYGGGLAVRNGDLFVENGSGQGVGIDANQIWTTYPQDLYLNYWNSAYPVNIDQTLNISGNQVWNSAGGDLLLNWNTPGDHAVYIGGGHEALVVNGGYNAVSTGVDGRAYFVAGNGWGSPNFSLYDDGGAHIETDGNALYINQSAKANVNIYGPIHASKSIYVDGGDIYSSGSIDAIRRDGTHAYLFPWSTGYADNTVYVGGGAVTNLLVTGTLQANGVVTAPAFLYSSDERLKKDIEPLTGNLAKVLALQPVSYLWKDPAKEGGATTTQIGFIAQEVQKIVPEIVHTDASTTLESIDYIKLTPLLVGSVQELNQEIQAQQQEIDELKAEVEALKNK